VRNGILCEIRKKNALKDEQIHRGRGMLRYFKKSYKVFSRRNELLLQRRIRRHLSQNFCRQLFPESKPSDVHVKQRSIEFVFHCLLMSFIFSTFHLISTAQFKLITLSAQFKLITLIRINKCTLALHICHSLPMYKQSPRTKHI
jgi:hypothetical protein